MAQSLIPEDMNLIVENRRYSLRGKLLNNKPKMTEIFCTMHPLLSDGALFLQSLQHLIVFLSLMRMFSEHASEGSCCCYSHLIARIYIPDESIS